MSSLVYPTIYKLKYDHAMGSVSFDGVRFQVYSLDHDPPHAHGFYGSTAIVVEFGNPNAIGVRKSSLTLRTAKRSDVKKIVDSALAHYAELVRLWEATHGPIK